MQCTAFKERKLIYKTTRYTGIQRKKKTFAKATLPQNDKVFNQIRKFKTACGYSATCIMTF